MEKIKENKKPIKQQFIEMGQELKRGILTINKEEKIPLQCKSMLSFLGRDFSGVKYIFKDWDLDFVSVVLKFVGLFFCIALVGVVITIFAGNNDMPLIVRYILPILCICLPFLMLWDIGNDKFLIELKKSRVMLFKAISLGCAIFLVILFAWLSTLFNWGYVLMPIALGITFIWIITEIIFLIKNTHKQDWVWKK